MTDLDGHLLQQKGQAPFIRWHRIRTICVLDGLSREGTHHVVRRSFPFLTRLFFLLWLVFWMPLPRHVPDSWIVNEATAMRLRQPTPSVCSNSQVPNDGMTADTASLRQVRGFRLKIPVHHPFNRLRRPRKRCTGEPGQLGYARR